MTIEATHTPVSAQERLSLVVEAVTSESSEWPNVTLTKAEDGATLVFTMHDHGDLAVTLTFSGNEWVVMSSVAPVYDVDDVAAFNDKALRLGLLLPLVSIGIMPINGVDHYVVYGQLFADCKLEAIREEVESCASAAIDVAELLADSPANPSTHQ